MSLGKLGDTALTTTVTLVAGAGAVLTALGALLYGQDTAFSVAMGAVTALSNLYVLSRIVAFVTVPDPNLKTQSAFAWGVLALAKIMVLFGGLWFLLIRHVVLPIPLVVGYGSLPIGIAIGAVVSDKSER